MGKPPASTSRLPPSTRARSCTWSTCSKEPPASIKLLPSTRARSRTCLECSKTAKGGLGGECMVHCEKGKTCRATKLNDSCNHDCGHCVVDSEAKFTDDSVLYSCIENDSRY